MGSDIPPTIYKVLQPSAELDHCVVKIVVIYSGRTKYSAFVSKLNKLSEEYLSPQKTQKAAVFFYWKDLRQEIDLKSEPK